MKCEHIQINTHTLGRIHFANGLCVRLILARSSNRHFVTLTAHWCAIVPYFVVVGPLCIHTFVLDMCVCMCVCECMDGVLMNVVTFVVGWNRLNGSMQIPHIPNTDTNVFENIWEILYFVQYGLYASDSRYSDKQHVHSCYCIQ